MSVQQLKLVHWSMEMGRRPHDPMGLWPECVVCVVACIEWASMLLDHEPLL
ncbi:conserved hypothetical protein [Ricinus communis]|uniref:Uncharacterized protein n=1 Tax=Ricinus communis TaxID=3988 RepID=B9SDX2_RICCO|nr:conserved hypothetical protein [Ricinus communis]